jgi:predicted ATPase/DNA-binding winged helix-turn-helix (wHTH) protein
MLNNVCATSASSPVTTRSVKWRENPSPSTRTEKFSSESAAMSEQGSNLIYESSQWQLHLGRRELRACGVPVPIGARAFEIMTVLVQSANELVTKDALMDRIWPGGVVGENTLHVHVAAIRKALGQDRTMLNTVSGRGYRLLGDWAVRRESAPEEPVGLQHMRIPARTFQTNLPETALDLIGRTIEVRQILDVLSSSRAITLTGPGGIGKTALALHVSHFIRPTFNGDIWLIELASLADRNLMPSAVAGVLGLNLGRDGITAEAVARAIGDKPLLLILDNCEHVIDATAGLVETILRLCQHTTALATSQEPLRIAGECVYRVPPLEMPRQHGAGPEELLEFSAVQLFVARLQASDSTFVVNRESVHSIAAICRHLDGIPLAIEFAAGRAAALGIEQVAVGLRDRFTLLTSGRRTAPPRHRTLRATLDWSYELLPEPERWLLCHLASFVGGFTSEAASAVVSDAGYPASVVLEGIANLVAKSFLTLDQSSSGGRWVLPETIRAYALEKLVDSGDVDATARRRAMIDLDLLEPAGRSKVTGIAGQAQEIENVRAAIERARPCRPVLRRN